METQLIEKIISTGSPSLILALAFIYLIKYVIPAFLDGLHKTNDQMQKIMEKQGESIQAISTSINSFEKSLLILENRISTKIDDTKSAIVSEIKDSKIEKLRESFTSEKTSSSKK